MLFVRGQVQIARGDLELGLSTMIQAADMEGASDGVIISAGAYFRNSGHMDQAMDLYQGKIADHPIAIRYAAQAAVMSELPPQRVQAAVRRWSDTALKPVTDQARSRALRSRKGRPLRVAFLTSFMSPPYFDALVPVFRALDRSRIHSSLYSSGTKGFANPAVVGSVSNWHNWGEPDDDLADLIRSERQDILVDLDGIIGKFTSLCAARPAPITVSWYNVVASLAAPVFDYLIVDRTVVPPEERIDWSERLVDMPATYFCMSPTDPRPEPRPSPAAARGYPTFGSMNRPSKIGRETLASWARILQAVPDARLYLRNSDFSMQGNAARIRTALADLGLPASRVDIHGGWAPFDQFLDSYGEFDIALDTFPFNGGTTTFDALWQGVPVIGFPGDRLAARVTASILRSAGLDELVAPNLAAAERLAIDLARRPEHLPALRTCVVERIRSCPFTDAQSFAAALTDNLERMFDERFAA